MKLLRPFLLLVLAAPLLAQAAPELPRATPSTVMPAVARVVALSAGGDLQAALDSAKAGDAIELPCPSTYSGNYVLRSSVVVRPACWAALPREGTRITPAVAAALRLPVVSTPNAAPVFQTVAGVHHVRLVGLEVTVGSAGGTNTLVALGSDAQTTLAEIPHDLVLDRLYLHGTPTTSLRRCVALNSGSTAIVDSWCGDAHENGSDSQAILGWTGPGPYLIRNNHLEAGHEVIMFGGGGDPLIVGLVASDVTIQRNHITRPVAWKGVWQTKNLLEFKSARRVLVEGNVLEHNWIDGQDGSGIVIKSTNQGGSCTWCGTLDVTVRWNIERNVGGGIVIAAHPEIYPVVPLARVAITDNLIVGIKAPGFPGVGTAFMLEQAIPDLAIARNTVVSDSAIGTVVFKPDPPLARFRFTNNLAVAGVNYGIYGDNTGPGLAALGLYAPGATVTGNLFAGANQYGLPSYVSGYPAGNRFLAQSADVGFANANAGDYSRTVVDSAGVNLAQLRTMVAGVAEADSVIAPPVVAPAAPSIALPAGGCWRAARVIPACVSDSTALTLVHAGALWRATPSGVVVLLAAGDSVTLRAEVVRTTLFVSPAGGPSKTPHVDTVVGGAPLGRRTVTLSLAGRTGHADVLVVP